MKNQRGASAFETVVVLGVAAVFVIVLGTIVLSVFGNSLGYAYGIVFAKTVTGQVVAIDNIQPNMIATSQSSTAQLFSSVVAIKQQGGDVITASAEDRQWYLVKKDMCITAKLYPYAPWFFSKAGTYHGARLEKITPCG